MTRAFVPDFITTQFERRRHNGSFEGATIFLDISGFTPLTAKLMAHGKNGADVISDTLNRMLSPMLDSVHQLGGFIAGFAGDAFIAVFPEENAHGQESQDSATSYRSDLTVLQRAALAAVPAR